MIKIRGGKGKKDSQKNGRDLDKTRGKTKKVGKKKSSQRGRKEIRKKKKKKRKKRTSFRSVGWVGNETTESKVAVSGDCEVRDRKLVKNVQSIRFCFVDNFCQTEVNVESQIKKNTVSGSLDIIVPKHDICLEKFNGFINHIRRIFCGRKR